ncbi:hypothetical protein [Legionella sp. km772]|nr:hypothetical protein [Legionella sp. km772]
MKNAAGGHGSNNESTEKKTGAQASQKSGRGSNLTNADRRKGGENSHKK